MENVGTTAPARLSAWEEVAGRLEVREDDLAALLPSVPLVAEARLGAGFAPEDIERLEQFIRCLRRFAAESVYGGGDL